MQEGERISGWRKAETALENGLFQARWLAAPIYFGLVFALLMLIGIFGWEIWTTWLHIYQSVQGTLPQGKAVFSLKEAVIAVLNLIDVALVANLVLIVIFAGYHNFVSKLDIGDHADRPEWMGTVDFTALKLKLFASIVAITGIELLKAFMSLRPSETGEYPEVAGPHEQALVWLVVIHFVFLFTAAMSALTDRLVRQKGK